MKHPVRAALWRQVVTCVPPTEVSLHLDDRLAITNFWLRSAAAVVAPISRGAPRKGWISQATEGLMRRRAQARSVFVARKRRLGEAVARIVLAAWASAGCVRLEQGAKLQVAAQHPRAWDRAQVVWSMQVDMAVALQWTLTLGAAVAGSVRADKISFIRVMGEQAKEAAAKGDGKTLHRIRRSLVPRPREQLAQVCSPDGLPLLDLRAVRLSWQGHFAKVLKADVVSFSDLQGRQEEERLRKFVAVEHEDSGGVLRVMPSLPEIAATFKRQRDGKGFGEDSIPSECYSAAHAQMARAFLPLGFASSLMGTHPLMWKGGFIAELYKNKGDPSQHSSFRDISLEDISSKAFCKVLRWRAQVGYAQFLRPMQFGGVPGRGPDLCQHFGRASFEAGRALRLSTGHVYVDLSSAFASVSRELLVGFAPGAGSLQEFIKKFGISEAFAQQVMDIMQSPTALQRVLEDQHAVRVMSELMDGTWFTTQGLESPCASHCGTKAGNPLGDWLFNVAVIQVLESLVSELRAAGLLRSFFYDPASGPFPGRPAGQVEVAEAAYVDDDLFATYSHSARGLVENIKKMARIVYRVLTSHGFVVNFAEGKTEASMLLIGRGAQIELQQMASLGSLRVVMEDDTEVLLRIVPHYKHMGGYTAANSSMAREARSRAQQGRIAVASLSKKVFTLPGLPVSEKDGLVASCVDSRVFYSCHAWSSLTEQQLGWLDAPRIMAWRRIRGWENAGKPVGSRCCDAAVVADARRLPAKQTVMLARLRYLPRLLRAAPPQLLALLQAGAGHSGSWTAALEEDVAALSSWAEGEAQQCAHLQGRYQPLRSAMAAVGSKPEDLVRWVGEPGAGWAPLLRAFSGHLRAAAAADASRAAARQSGEGEPPPDVLSHFCFDCGCAFQSRAFLMGHAARVHSYKNPVRRLVQGDSCVICLKMFWSPERVFHHLLRSRCGELAEALTEPLALDASEALFRSRHAEARLNVQQGQSHRRAYRAAVQMHGPRIRGA